MKSVFKQPAVYFHIGTHKTGTSSIQTYLTRHSQYLADKWQLQYIRQPFNSYKFSLEDEPDEAHIERLQDYYQAQITNHDLTYIISAEDFSGSLERGYSNFHTMIISIKRMLPNVDLKFIIYIRPQYSFIESAYAQLVQIGARYSFSEYLNKLPEGAFCWKQHLDTIASVFGRESIIVRVFDPETFLDGNLIKDFFSAINPNIPINELSKSLYKNVSMPNEALIFFQKHVPQLTATERKKLRRQLQNLYTNEKIEKRTWFEPEQRLNYFQSHVESNQALEREYFNGKATCLTRQPAHIPHFEQINSESAILSKLLLRNEG